MKISLHWLNDYVDLKDYFAKPKDLADLLTGAGIEVENIDNQNEKYRGVVVGQVIELGQHPDADRLTLCQVDVGDGQNRQIVCGAKNHRQGDKVVVALPGAVLPGDFAIKLSKIRGVESQGMMCSETELGIKDEAEGILILGEDAPVGTHFSEFYGFNDVIFELSVTPNRADCLSHFGLARELGAILNRQVMLPSVTLTKESGQVKEFAELTVNDSELCPRYCGRGVSGVQVGPSPAWLKRRLEAVGMNTINNVVDITNFVMMELGQPLHAFDAGTISGGKIIVDRSQSGEKFITLDGTELELTGRELMIRDAQRPVALAGVVGGLNSGVTDNTQRLFLESAHFLPQTVRQTSRHFGIETDSGYRFARGTDPDGVLFAMNRACSLFQEICGGTVTEDFYDHYPEPSEPVAITLSQSYLQERLGYEADMKLFTEWMTRLGCTVEVFNKKDNIYQVTPPPYRWDLALGVDLVEEYARLNGYDKIPETTPPLVNSPSPHSTGYLNERVVVRHLKSQGYHQAINYGFLHDKFQQPLMFNNSVSEVSTRASALYGRLGFDVSEQPVRVKNPLSEETNVMRSLLLPGLIKNLLHNYRHGMGRGRLFEVGYAFSRLAEQYKHNHHLALVAWGQAEGLWDKPGDRPVVFDLKSAVENLLKGLHSQTWQWRPLREEDLPPFLHPGQSVGLFFEGRTVGFMGALHPELVHEFKLRNDCAVAEFNLESLMRGQPRTPKVKKISKFPGVERDLAFLVPSHVSAGDMVREIQKVAGSLLQEVSVFDVYQGSELPDGHSSIAFKLLYQDDKGTLQEEQLSDLQSKVIGHIKSKLQVEVR
ncbi:MAG: phenylalanine--tRNA ligase subunit beta [Pseudobdellovibrionaceae bacterium]|nr:MAG: phenylalanine--tRNA ligase subunit beta [Pseudobdellovibrionaceae bacterium]